MSVCRRSVNVSVKRMVRAKQERSRSEALKRKAEDYAESKGRRHHPRVSDAMHAEPRSERKTRLESETTTAEQTGDHRLETWRPSDGHLTLDPRLF